MGIFDSAVDIISDPIGAITGPQAKAKGIEVDEAAFTFEGESAEEQRRKAEAARQQAAPQITAADVAGAQIQQAAPALAPTVGAVDPVTGIAIGGADAATAAQVADEFRRSQQGLVAGLEEQVAGGGPSVAELQLRAGQEQNIRQSIAGAASAPGGNPALAQRVLAQTTAEGARETNQAAAILRAQEQATARGELAGVLGTSRQQDVAQAGFEQEAELANLSDRTQRDLAQGTIDLATAQQNQQITADLVAQQAGLDAQTAIANLNAAKEQAIAQGNIDLAINLEQARLDQEASTINLSSELEQQRITNELVQFYESLGFQTEMAQFQADQDLQRLLVDQNLGIQTANVQAAAAQQAARAGAIGAIAGGVGTAIGSDIRLKTDIHAIGDSEIGEALAALAAGDEPIAEFLDALEPYKFRYKDPNGPGATHGDIIGVMAQDAEKSAAGREIVFETAIGKMLDVPKALSLALASSANLNERMKALEN